MPRQTPVQVNGATYAGAFRGMSAAWTLAGGPHIDTGAIGVRTRGLDIKARAAKLRADRAAQRLAEDWLKLAQEAEKPPKWRSLGKLIGRSVVPRGNQGEKRATIRMRMAPGVG
jgi:hypothetical protein